jgi:hypothetical protein
VVVVVVLLAVCLFAVQFVFNLCVRVVGERETLPKRSYLDAQAGMPL